MKRYYTMLKGADVDGWVLQINHSHQDLVPKEDEGLVTTKKISSRIAR